MCFSFCNTINGWLYATIGWSSLYSTKKQKRHKPQGSQQKRAAASKQHQANILIGNSSLEKQHEHLNFVLQQDQLDRNHHATFENRDQYERNILITGSLLSMPKDSNRVNTFTHQNNTSSDHHFQHQAEEPPLVQQATNMSSTANGTTNNENNNSNDDNNQNRDSGNTGCVDSSHATVLPTGGPEPVGSSFRIRTANRRHLDFEPEFNLDDVNAAGRSKWSGPFHFIQAADSQFGMIDSYIHKRPEPGWQDEIELCERLVKACNLMEPKPKFMIVCGDLADAWPATDVRRRQVVDFKRIFSKLDPCIPLVCVCGNHDIGDQPTMASISEYRGDFGDDYFYFTLNDVLFIVINSQFYQHRDYVIDYAKEQDEWLERMLAKCKLFKYSIIFEHIPWFLKNSDEEDDYFNIKKEVRLKWLEKFRDAGVTKIMCGHYHRNAGGWFDNMELVVTSAIGAQCGDDKSGVRIVRVLDESIEHQYYNMQDIPKDINLA